MERLKKMRRRATPARCLLEGVVRAALLVMPPPRWLLPAVVRTALREQVLARAMCKCCKLVIEWLCQRRAHWRRSGGGSSVWRSVVATVRRSTRSM